MVSPVTTCTASLGTPSWAVVLDLRARCDGRLTCCVSTESTSRHTQTHRHAPVWRRSWVLVRVGFILSLDRIYDKCQCVLHVQWDSGHKMFPCYCGHWSCHIRKCLPLNCFPNVSLTQTLVPLDLLKWRLSCLVQVQQWHGPAALWGSRSQRTLRRSAFILETSL